MEKKKLTRDEEAEEIVKRLKTPPSPPSRDAAYFYCPYIPLELVSEDGRKILREMTNKINEATGIPIDVFKNDKKEE